MTFGEQGMEHIQRHIRQGAFTRTEYHRLVAQCDRLVFVLYWLDICIPGGLYSLLHAMGTLEISLISVPLTSAIQLAFFRRESRIASMMCCENGIAIY